MSPNTVTWTTDLVREAAIDPWRRHFIIDGGLPGDMLMYLLLTFVQSATSLSAVLSSLSSSGFSHDCGSGF